MESQECSHNKPKHNTGVIFKQTSATLYSLDMIVLNPSLMYKQDF